MNGERESVLDLTKAAPASSTVVVVELEGPPLEVPQGFSPGPLPIMQAHNETTRRRAHTSTTDSAARRTLVASQQADVLYGGATLRCHRVIGSGVLALEVLQRGQASFLVVHVAPRAELGDADWVDQALASRRLSGPLWDAVAHELGVGLHVAPQARPRVLRFLATTGAIEPIVVTYALVLGKSPDDGDVMERARTHSLTIARPDWSCLVLRDGAAFVAHQSSAEDYASSLQVFVHSIHTDALLLALLQRVGVDESSRQTVSADLREALSLQRLESDHFEFKRTLWRTSLTTKRTSPSDEVLRAFQSELLTERDLADVEERVRDGARLAVSRFTAAQEQAQQRLNRMVQNSSVVIGAFALSLTAAPVLAEPGLDVFLLALAVGAIGAIVAFAFLRLTGRRAETHEDD